MSRQHVCFQLLISTQKILRWQIGKILSIQSFGLAFTANSTLKFNNGMLLKQLKFTLQLLYME
ncbi:hypothetical protein CDG79_26460 [Nostoc sp. 'Peltigera membranacea cyanobiont' 232]|nr:hypothetical protein CDG79_26460 [Nostoc sp. 'Peltigera membranacea cyanobiont' 232]